MAAAAALLALAALAAGADAQMAPALMLSPDAAGNVFGDTGSALTAGSYWSANPAERASLPTHTPPMGTQSAWTGWHPDMPGTDYDPLRPERFKAEAARAQEVDGGPPYADLRWAPALLERRASWVRAGGPPPMDQAAPAQQEAAREAADQREAAATTGDPQASVRYVHPSPMLVAPNGGPNEEHPGFTSVYDPRSPNNPSTQPGTVLPLPWAATFLRSNVDAQREAMWVPKWGNADVGEPGGRLTQLQGFEFLIEEGACVNCRFVG